MHRGKLRWRMVYERDGDAWWLLAEPSHRPRHEDAGSRGFKGGERTLTGSSRLSAGDTRAVAATAARHASTNSFMAAPIEKS